MGEQEKWNRQAETGDPGNSDTEYHPVRARAPANPIRTLDNPLHGSRDITLPETSYATHKELPSRGPLYVYDCPTRGSNVSRIH